MRPENTSRRGLKIYRENPFLLATKNNTQTGARRVYGKKAASMMVIGGGGEYVGPAGFWTFQEVDKTAFVKLYVNGVKALKDLTGAGAKVFEILYHAVQSNIGKDRVFLSLGEIDQQATPISKATFMRGMRELVVGGFIAETPSSGWYYINPDYIFNGDRLAFVREIRLKGTKARDVLSGDLFNAAEALAAPAPIAPPTTAPPV